MAKNVTPIAAAKGFAQDFNPKPPQTKKDTFRIIILEDIDFGWTASDMETFRGMWSEGISIRAIASALKRDVDEVALLAIHEAREGLIQPRAGGVWGAGTDDAGED